MALKSGAILAAVAALWTFPALAKTPGQTYCFRGVCHRVLTVEETKRMVGRTETVVASFYDDPKVDAANPNIMTSSGERFDPRSDRTVASPIYPNGTRLLLWNPKTRAAAEVRVTNSGPYHGVRRIDVSAVAAEKLGFRRFGVSQIAVTVVGAPSEDEARYVKGRKYAAVPGYLGVFESQDAARLAVLARQPTTAGAIASMGVAPPAPLTTGSVGWVTTAKPVMRPLSKSVAPAAPPLAPLSASGSASASGAVARPAPAQTGASKGEAPRPDWATTMSSAPGAPAVSGPTTSPKPDGKALGLR